MVFTLVFRLLSCVDFVGGTHATCPYCWHPSLRVSDNVRPLKGPLVSDRHSTSELSVLSSLGFERPRV